MRIILMGTGPFAVPTCERLLADGHDIPLVVTRPLVNPNAKKLPPRPVYDWSQAAGLPTFEPASINTPDAIGELKNLNADLFFVCDYGQILSKECLEASKLGGINLHGSLLPRHRGAAPVQWSLLRGDKVAGVSVMHMTPRLDAGPTLAICETKIREDETAEELEPRLAEIGIDATVESFDFGTAVSRTRVSLRGESSEENRDEDHGGLLECAGGEHTPLSVHRRCHPEMHSMQARRARSSSL